MRRTSGWQRYLRFARLLVLAAIAAAFPPPVRAEEEPLYFVQITDTHFGVGDHAERTARVVERINGLPMPIAFVVHTGDIASDNLDDPAVLNTASSTLARLNMPVHFLPGNHDILPARVAPTLGAYTNTFGPLASRAEYGGVVFLFLYTEPLGRDVRIAGYDPLAWLAGQLEAARGRPVIVCHHRPPTSDFYNNAMHESWPPDTRAAWNRLLSGADVKAVLCGHFHRDELHWDGDIPLYAGASVAGYWGRQGSFRLYEYRAGRLGYRTIYLE